jgi:hypothetical protein
LVLCTDSHSLYKYLVKLGTTVEKRLIIDIIYIHQSYKRHEIAEIKWIKGTSNQTDSIIKTKPIGALKLLLDSNTIQLEVDK